MQSVVQKKFPKEFKAKIQEIEKNGKNQPAIIEFTIGNYHELVKNPKKTSKGNEVNRHFWIAFVQYTSDKCMTSRFVEKVKFELCEGFNPPIRIVKSQPGKRVEISTKGWGYFDLPMTIYFKKSLGLEPVTIEHELCFDGDGKWEKYRFEVSKARLRTVMI